MELPWGINVSCYSYCLILLDLASSYFCGSILKQAWMQLKQGDWSKATIHTLDSSQCVFRYLDKYLTLKHGSSIWLQVGRQSNRPFWSHWSGKWDPFTWAFFESSKGFSAESRSGKTNGCVFPVTQRSYALLWGCFVFEIVIFVRVVLHAVQMITALCVVLSTSVMVINKQI